MVLKVKLVKSIGEVELKKLVEIANSSETAKVMFAHMAAKERNRGFFDIPRLRNEIVLTQKPLKDEDYQFTLKLLESEGYGKVMGTRFVLGSGNGIKSLGSIGSTGKLEEAAKVVAKPEKPAKKQRGRPKGSKNKHIKPIAETPKAPINVPAPESNTVVVILSGKRKVTITVPPMSQDEADKVAEAIKAVPRARIA